MSYCVYWIHHTEHTDMFTQGYIGITKNFKQRMRFHKMLKCNAYFSNAIKKYGWDNLVKKVMLVSDKDYCIDIETKLRSQNSIGWNLVKGGGLPPINTRKGYKMSMPVWNKGKAWSEEQKKQISIGVKKLWENHEYRQHMSNAHKGKPSHRKGKFHSKETILKMSESKKGKPSLLKGTKLPLKQIEKMKQTANEQSWTCPHCLKQGKAKGAGNRWHFNNCKGKT